MVDSLPKPTTYLGRIITPIGPHRVRDIRHGALIVGTDGKIIRYGKREELAGYAAEVVDLRDHILMPGLIDLHAHLPQFDVVAAEAENLLSWLVKHAYPAEVRFKQTKVARNISRRFFRGLVAAGTTTACVYGGPDPESTEVAFQEAERSGLRIIMGQVMMDRSIPDELRQETRITLKESEQLCSKWHLRDDGRLRYSFIPRSATCCSRDLLETAAALSRRYGAPIQTHLAESPEDVSWLREAHPAAKGYAHVYHESGLLSAGTVAAHAIYLSRAELEIIKRTHTGIAHCPSSNLFLACGIMDLHERVLCGIDIGLGTDVAGGPSLSLFREMAMACLAARALHVVRRDDRLFMEQLRASSGPSQRRLSVDRLDVPPNEATEVAVDAVHAFYLATLGGAKAINLQDRVGSFARGKDADFIVVDYSTVDPTQGSGLDLGVRRILSTLAHRADPRMVLKTFVRGKELSAAA